MCADSAGHGDSPKPRPARSVATYAPAMTERESDVPSTTREAGKPADAAFFVLLVGLTACVTAVVSGLVLALDRVEVDCPDGTSFPEGASDFTCYTHPTNELGISIMAIAVAVGVALVLLRAILDAVREPQRPSDGQDD
jgi:hypothetical protein